MLMTSIDRLLAVATTPTMKIEQQKKIYPDSEKSKIDTCASSWYQALFFPPPTTQESLGTRPGTHLFLCTLVVWCKTLVLSQSMHSFMFTPEDSCIITNSHCSHHVQKQQLHNGSIALYTVLSVNTILMDTIVRILLDAWWINILCKCCTLAWPPTPTPLARNLYKHFGDISLILKGKLQ